jgi:hypothetical protein
LSQRLDKVQRNFQKELIPLRPKGKRKPKEWKKGAHQKQKKIKKTNQKNGKPSPTSRNLEPYTISGGLSLSFREKATNRFSIPLI